MTVPATAASAPVGHAHGTGRGIPAKTVPATAASRRWSAVPATAASAPLEWSHGEGVCGEASNTTQQTCITTQTISISTQT